MPKPIGEALRRIRQSRGLSLDEAAKLAGIRKDVLFRYEAGITARPNAAMLARLAAAYNTTIDHILSLAEDKPPLHLKRTLTDPSTCVLWEENRPLTFQERQLIASAIELWLRLTEETLDALLPADERELLEQYRAHRDRFLDAPDPELLAAANALATLAKHPDRARQQATAPASPRTRPSRRNNHPKAQR